MEMNNPTFQEALVEWFLNTFSSPFCSKAMLRPEMVGTKNMVQRIELEGKDEQNSTSGCDQCVLHCWFQYCLPGVCAH